MHDRLFLIGMIGAVALLTGCIHQEVDGFDLPDMDVPDVEDPRNGGEGEQSLYVDGPTCTVDGVPCRDTDITTISTPRITMDVQNPSEVPIHIDLSDAGSSGDELLTDTCSAFTVKTFDASVNDRDVSRQRTVTLDGDDTLSLTWYGAFDDVGNLTVCPLAFQVTFQQSVAATRQIQVREHGDVPPASGLDTHTDTTSPVELVIDSAASPVQDTIDGRIAPIQISAYLRNHGNGNITGAEHQRYGDLIHLSAPRMTRTQCGDQERQVAGESVPGVVCQFRPDPVELSQIFTVNAETTYTYLLNRPNIDLHVMPVEERP